jgi:maltose alpha-D-glucosyltransferase/alpha-amylase
MLKQSTDLDPLWYKDAVIYELHVRAFCDANGDGIGDFRGLTDKLDYLQELGVTALWLLPFYPSPLRDDGYDIADYRGIHPSYGNMRDFRRFLKAAHQRNLKVITELVINHTSSDHSWFQRARRAPAGSPHRDFYVWTQQPEQYGDARIIFKDFESSNWTWDPIARAYFWHRFYSHQPDLNFDNPRVQRAVFQVMDYWLEMGVDGLRLDAVPYLFEREGTGCENLDETHAFLRRLRAYIDERYQARMLLAEANQWPEDAAAYFGQGDECHMNFHFPLMPRLFMALRLEDARPIVDILGHTPPIPDRCQWATFLRNHDELTLEMVTDEEREYMVRVYAGDPRARINLGIRRRLAPLLGLRRKVELMHGLLFGLPGTPVLYYGDEIGMGDNIYLGDRNGVRTPMQWSGDRNAGFSRANPQTLYLPPITDPEYHYEAINVEAQTLNPSSLLSWMRRMIRLRRQYPVFGRGSIEIVETGNPRVLAFVRKYQQSRMLVVANLSRFMQYGRLQLARYADTVPVEVFGHNVFPAIEQQPYFLSLGPHGFCWFSLAPAPAATRVAGRGELGASGTWHDVLITGRDQLEQILPAYIREQRWFRSKSHTIRSVSIVDAVALAEADAEVIIIRVDYQDREPDQYVLPVGFAVGEVARAVEQERPSAVIAPLVVEASGERTSGLLFDASARAPFALVLLEAMRGRGTLPGRRGELRPTALRALRQLAPEELRQLSVKVGSAEQSNTSLIYGSRFIMKLFRRVEEGLNPDVEIGRFLTERQPFEAVPALGGFIEYRRFGSPAAAVAMLQQLVPSEGDGWQYTLGSLGEFTARCRERPSALLAELRPTGSLLERAATAMPPALRELVGDYAAKVELLGQRTAQMHQALAADPDDPEFCPEELSSMDQRSLYEGARSRLKRSFELVERNLATLPSEAAAQARLLLGRRPELDGRLRRVIELRVEGLRIRCHGDYHLGQVLYTGHDFVIIDFEGEPARPLGERRLKRSPVLDVAGMLRSLHYASVTAMRGEQLTEAERATLRPWLEIWHGWVTAAFLGSYLAVVKDCGLVPTDPQELQVLLDALVIDKCLYEVGYEANNRPDWVQIPLEGLLQILGT